MACEQPVMRQDCERGAGAVGPASRRATCTSPGRVAREKSETMKNQNVGIPKFTNEDEEE
jgi:hypothetical protein